MPWAEDLLAGLPEAIVELDETGKVTGWHGSAERLFGWAAEEAAGKDINELLVPRLPGGETAILTPPGNPGRMAGHRGDAAGGEQSTMEQELLLRGKDGSDVWVSLAYGVFSGEGEGSERVVAVFRDIRHRKGVDLAKSEVISSVAHELRSPLTSIKGFAATLVKRWDRFDDDKRKQILVTIEADADRVTRLISELLDLSRLEEGRLQLRKQPIQVPLIAERVVGRMKDRSAGHSLGCSFPNPFPSVMADPDKVEQVLTNLVENAVKYTEKGEVKVGGAVDESAVRIAVTDQGAGIPPDHRQKVFRKFFRRADAGPSAPFLPPGSGLGLYISKGLIEAHGGAIWVDEAPGGGASFAFTLPLE